MPSRTSSEGRRRENRDRQRFADRGRNPAAGDRAGAWPGSGLGGVQRPGSRRAMRPRPSRRRADGPDHAGHGWRRGHPPHHGRDALRHRGGHGRRGAPRRGCSTPWATALDAADTPVVGSADLRGAAAPLLRKIRNIGWLIGRYGSRPTLTPVARPSEQPDSRRLLVIGASAGRPATLAQLLRDIPLDFPAGIVLVQHVDASFAAGMADWLNDQVPLPVRLVREGETGRRTGVAGRHRRPSAYAGRWYPALHRKPKESLYRPSIDVFFHSVAEHWRGMAVGVLLTGMGQDGARG